MQAAARTFVRSGSRRTFCGLAGKNTHTNLQDAFAQEAMGYQRMNYFAAGAEIEGFVDAGAALRSIGKMDEEHAMGIMEFLETVSDPATNHEIGGSDANLQSAAFGEGHVSI